MVAGRAAQHRGQVALIQVLGQAEIPQLEDLVVAHERIAVTAHGIERLDAPPAAGVTPDEDVGRLDVAVGHVLRVHGIEAGCEGVDQRMDALGSGTRRVHGDQPVLEGSPVGQVQHQVGPSVLQGADVVDGHDVGTVHPPQQPPFTGEPLGQIVVVHELTEQDLDGDPRIQVFVDRLEHLGERTEADQPVDAVAPDVLRSGQEPSSPSWALTSSQVTAVASITAWSRSPAVTQRVSESPRRLTDVASAVV